MSGQKIDMGKPGVAPRGRKLVHGDDGAFQLRLPATSANLGPGFDAVAVALDFFLEIEAEPAQVFSVTASGRNADRCARLEDNLILETYKQVLSDSHRAIVPLKIRMVNGIPLGMGCGSSAAARLAAIALAVHFGKLGWDTERVLEEAYKLEGHPDNVAACWLGGFVTAVCEGTKVRVARADPPEEWRAIVALPDEPLSTSKARAVLPASYSLEDVVANLQSVAVLTLAFAQGRADLLRLAMRDRIHQPYRAPITPLLPILLPQVGSHGILGVALSGAGPAVLVIVEREKSLAGATKAVQKAAENRMGMELRICGFSRVGACQAVEK
ncbi:MAG: homoserine kinase [Terracidiphilus sp.]